jgi:hypothetical protein
MSSRNYWSDEETEYLRKSYAGNVRTETICKELKGKSVGQIYSRIRYLGLKQRGRGTNQPSKITWTKEDVSFIKNNFHQMTNVQLAKSLGKQLTIVRMKCRELNLLHIELEYWTAEQVDYLKANYKTIGDTAMAKLFESKWPKKKGWSRKHIEKKRRYLKLKRTMEEEFTIRTGRFDAAQYKDFNGKEFKQGRKRLWFQNGKYRWMIKVGKSFVHLHRHKWETLRGPIPNNKKLCFKDGDTTNVRMSNLICLTRSQLANRVASKIHDELSDSYIAGLLSWRNPEMKKHLLNHPGIIEAKRAQILENRAAGRSRCKPKTKK